MWESRHATDKFLPRKIFLSVIRTATRLYNRFSIKFDTLLFWNSNGEKWGNPWGWGQLFLTFDTPNWRQNRSWCISSYLRGDPWSHAALPRGSFCPLDHVARGPPDGLCGLHLHELHLHRPRKDQADQPRSGHFKFHQLPGHWQRDSLLDWSIDTSGAKQPDLL